MNKTFMWVLIIVVILVIAYFILAYDNPNEPQTESEVNNTDTNETVYDINLYFPDPNDEIVDGIALTVS